MFSVFQPEQTKNSTLNTTNTDNLVEAELIEKAKEDLRFFKPLYEKYYEQVFRVVYARVGEVELAGEVCSEAFAKAMVNLSKFKYKGFPFSAWLVRIAINCCHDYFRAAKAERTIGLESYLNHDLIFEIELDNKEKDIWLEVLPEVLRQLKPEELELVELRFFEGRSYSEIAYLLGIKEGNAKTKTYRILKRMKSHFKTSAR